MGHHPQTATSGSTSRIDYTLFIPALVMVIIVGSYLVLEPVAALELTNRAMAYVTREFGWLFLLSGTLALGFTAWLAFGRYGSVLLGDAGQPPEYSEFHWASMMFSAGIGIGLVSWAFVEPIYYMVTPPMGIEAHTAKAAEWAHMYPMFHWGLVPWALYTIPSVAVAYMLHVKKIPRLRISAACSGILRTPRAQRLAPVIDTLVIVGLIGGAGTSLGLGVPLVSAFSAQLLGIPDTFYTQLLVLAIWTLLFGVSVYRGLKRGIRILSDINIGLAIFIIVFVLLTGPTLFILSITTNSVGLLANNFLQMSFWLDPVENNGFPEAWTIFYWAWWVAYAPMMGLFFGRISRGRTIRQLVIGIIGWGSVGCWSFLAVCGAYAMNLELSDPQSISQTLQSQGIANTVVQIVAQMPLGNVMVFIYTLLSFVFLATTLDSAAYVLASISTHDLPGDEEPGRANRLTWAFALAFIAVGLLSVGGLKAVQSSTIVAALPLIPVLGLIALSLLRWLKEDEPKIVQPAP